MNGGTVFFLLLLLACPLLMLFMHRGGGHGSHASHGTASGTPPGSSLEELRRRRTDLDAEIAGLEQAETETKTPAPV